MFILHTDLVTILGVIDINVLVGFGMQKVVIHHGWTRMVNYHPYLKYVLLR